MLVYAGAGRAKVWHQARPTDRRDYQLMFCRFLQLLADLRHARVVFETFYKHSMNVPERYTQGHHIMSISDPTSQTLSRDHVAALENAAKKELETSGFT